MRVVGGVSNHRGHPKGLVLTIGNFDGVHLGHRRILQQIGDRAHALGADSALLTFDPPPARVLGRRPLTPQISTLADRAWLLKEAGLDAMIVQPFNLDFAGLTHQAFVEDVLEGGLAPKELWVGYDFVFGRGRGGDVPFLRSFFEPLGRQVCQVEAVRGQDGDVLSSTRVRRLIGLGDVAGASALLGRPHFIRGTVIHGDKQGRNIGFPTANIDALTELLPAHGVYATWLSVDGSVYPGVTNVGERPTVEANTLRVESHLFDQSLDLYGQEVTLWFASRLRDERKFPSFDALRLQIDRDAREGRRRLQGLKPPGLVARSTSPGRPEIPVSLRG